jgi:hypothetical protein
MVLLVLVVIGSGATLIFLDNDACFFFNAEISEEPGGFFDTAFLSDFQNKNGLNIELNSEHRKLNNIQRPISAI